MINESKIKLLIFTPTLQCGGSEKFVSLLCNHINTDKFSVYLAVLDNANQFYTIKNTAVQLIDLKESRVRYSLFKIKKIIKDYQPDIVFSTANHLNLYFAIFRNWFPGQLKFIARESSIVSINNRRAGMPWLYNKLIKKYFKRFNLIICQGTYMQQDIVLHYNVPLNKTAVVYNAVENNAVKKEDSVGNGNKVHKLICVTRLSEEKGIERLIHAVGLLTAPFNFYIIGDGDKKESLQKLINELQLQDKIFLQGKKENPFDGLHDADLFLMGSYYEGFPNVLLEAGSLGIPVVAFNAPGGIAEIIINGENGLLVDDNDILGFASAVNKGLSLQFNQNLIIESTQKRFSIDTMINRIEELLMQQ